MMPCLKSASPGKGGDDRLALRVGELVIAAAGDVHAGARLHQRDLRAHEFRDAGRGVQGDRVPDRLDIAFGDAVAAQEIARGVGAVHFEAQPAVLIAGVRPISWNMAAA